MSGHWPFDESEPRRGGKRWPHAGRNHHRKKPARRGLFADLQLEVRTWAVETFPNQTNQGLVAHLLEEVGELHDAVGSGGEAEEIADCVLLLLDLAGALGLDLEAEVRRKLAICRKRDWGARNARNAEGYVNHVPDEVEP